MFNFKEILSVSLILFSVIDILGSVPIIIDLRKKAGHVQSEKATLASGLLMILFFGVLTGAGLMFGTISVGAMLCSTVFREVQRKYEDAPQEDPEEMRGWQDLFRPWYCGK